MMHRAYFSLKDIKDLYLTINGSKKGVKKFLNKICTDVPYVDFKGAQLFNDEKALFKVFRGQFKELFAKKKIGSWEELMSRFS